MCIYFLHLKFSHLVDNILAFTKGQIKLEILSCEVHVKMVYSFAGIWT